MLPSKLYYFSQIRMEMIWYRDWILPAGWLLHMWRIVEGVSLVSFTKKLTELSKHHLMVFKGTTWRNNSPSAQWHKNSSKKVQICGIFSSTVIRHFFSHPLLQSHRTASVLWRWHSSLPKSVLFPLAGISTETLDSASLSCTYWPSSPHRDYMSILSCPATVLP